MDSGGVEEALRAEGQEQMKKASTDFFDLHLANIRQQVAAGESLSVFLTQLKKESEKRAKSIDFEKDPIPYAIANLQTQNHDGALSVVGLMTVLLKEFAQVWEQHKLLSEYVDEALGETSNAIRADFRRKQKEMMDRYDPLFQGVMSYLDKAKENRQRFQGGPGDI